MIFNRGKQVIYNVITMIRVKDISKWAVASLLVLFFALAIGGCDKDELESWDLSGTYWKHTYHHTQLYHYTVLHFTSSSKVEVLQKPLEKPLFKSGDGKYKVEGNRITIDLGDKKMVGTIYNEEINIRSGAEQFIFVRDVAP